MARPFERYDGIKVKGIDRLLCIVNVVPDYGAERWIVFAEDMHTLERVTVNSDLCEFVHLGQLSLFDSNGDI